jgi:hypothetical protein
VRFRIALEPERPAENAEPGERELTPAARPPRRQTAQTNWLVASLVLVCLVESLIIAGLLASRATISAAATRQPSPASTTASTMEGPPPVAPAPAAPARSSAGRQATQTKPPTTASKPAATPPPITLTRGWLTIEAPFELQIFEGRTLLGTTKSERVSLLAGPHELRLVNTSLNYESAITVEIPPGVGITTRVAAPNGTLSLNAVPWANVSLDGKSLGTTPVMNLSVPVGRHEVTWRHPQLGERRQTAIVTARGPVTLVMDLRR